MPQGKSQKRNARLTPKELRYIHEYFESTSRVLSLEAVQHICRMLEEIKILRSEVRYLNRCLGVKHD